MRSARRMGRESAFTLVEILVVTAILAIVVGLTVVRLEPSDARRLEGAAESLVRQLETARDEAITRGRALAFSSDGQGYQFWIADTGKDGWLALADNRNLVSGRFSPDVSLRSIQVNGMSRPLGERLVFPISGISESFLMTMAVGSVTLDIQGDALGRVEINRAP